MKKFSVLPALLLCLLLFGCQSEAEPAVAYDDVSGINGEALVCFDRGDFEDALKKYTEAMTVNPIDMDAMLGAAKCQIALKNYALASVDLSASASLDPTRIEIYDLYLELSRESENISYARTAVALAKRHNIESFLSRVPDAPVLNYGTGTYDAKFEVEISAAAGADIFVEQCSDHVVQSYLYDDPILVTRGSTDLTVYCVKDGIPSEATYVSYLCDYPPVDVTFADPVIESLVRLTLGIENGPVTDVDCENIVGLYQYDLYNNGMDWETYQNVSVTTFEDLNLFPNLQSLYLQNVSPISDYTPLITRKNLFALDLSSCGLTDIAFMGYLTGLQYAWLSDNQITDLTPLRSCEDLQILNLRDNRSITDLSPLEGMEIESLYVNISSIPDLSVFPSWENLTSLVIYGCGGRDISVLGELNHLTRLEIYNSESNYWTTNTQPIGDISFLSNMPQLEGLAIHGLADYSQIEIIQSLSNLTELLLERQRGSGSVPDSIIQSVKNWLPNCKIGIY